MKSFNHFLSDVGEADEVTSVASEVGSVVWPRSNGVDLRPILSPRLYCEPLAIGGGQESRKKSQLSFWIALVYRLRPLG